MSEFNFTTIPEAEMAKPKTYNKTSAETLKRQAAYDNFLKSLKSGQAGVVEIREGENARKVRMNLRYASDRTGININKVVVTEQAVQFTVGGTKASKSQPIGATA